MNRRGQVMLYIVFMIVAIVIIVIASVLVPIGVRLNTQLYAVGEDILADANDSISNINDAAVRASIQSSTETAMAAAEDNILTLNDIFRYSWIAAIGITGLVVFMLSRRLIEVGGGGFV